MAAQQGLTESLEVVLPVLAKIRTALAPIDEALARLDRDLPAFSALHDAATELREVIPEVEESCKEVITGKVWVGIVGHYSHGKSSLLNALLQTPDAEEMLPTGEGVVTGMVSRIEFSSSRRSHAFRILRGTESIDLSEDEYRAKVTGRSDLTGVYSFDLELATTALANPDMWEKMDQRHIALFDTPGLGGPYFKDANAVSLWMAQFMLLVVCIRADAIHAEVASNLTPFLRDAPKKIIPVITFWDKWRECADYKGISSDEKAQERAKELLRSRFPFVGDSAHKAIFVSARNYRSKSDPHSDDAKTVSPLWNIDSLRHCLYQEVDPSTLGRTATVTPFEAFRARRLLTRIGDAERKIGASQTRIALLTKAAKGSVIDAGPVEEALQSFAERCDRDYDRLASEFEDRVIGVSAEIGAGKMTAGNAVEEMKRECVKIGETFANAFVRTAKRDFDAKVLRAVSDAAEHCGLSRDRADKLRDDVARASKDFFANVADMRFAAAVQLPDAATIAMHRTIETIKLMFNIAKNPAAWQPLLFVAGAIILSFFVPLLLLIPTVGKYFLFLIPILWFIAIGSFMIFFYDERLRSLEVANAKFRKSCRDSVSRDALCRSIRDILSTEWESLGERIQNSCRKIDESVTDVKDSLREVERVLGKTSSNLNELGRSIREIERRIQ